MLALANLALCAAIVYLTISRITRTNLLTRASIRWSLAAMLTGATAMGIAPLVWGMDVHPAMLLMEGGHAAFLIACKRLWEYGTPLALMRGAQIR